jgi:hypothetical protein
MEIDDKGREIETKILQLGIWAWTMDKEGATLKNGKGSKLSHLILRIKWDVEILCAP